MKGVRTSQLDHSRTTMVKSFKEDAERRSDEKTTARSGQVRTRDNDPTQGSEIVPKASRPGRATIRGRHWRKMCIQGTSSDVNL